MVIASDGSHPPIQLSDRAAWYADWSAQGGDVFFIRANSPAAGDEQRLGSLSRARIFDDHFAMVEKAPAVEDLVGVMYSELSRVRCLKSGRILFASVDVKLPATSGDLPDRPELFSIHPEEQATVSRVLTGKAAQEIGDAAQYFEVSPDGKHVSIPDKTGKVYVVNLGDDVVTEAQPRAVTSSENKTDLLSVPQWRSDDELTFVAPGADNQASVQLWSVSSNSGKTLSSKWPADLVAKKSGATNEEAPGGL
jgi:hypothetical protein